jgi:two-component system response regulator
LSWILLVEDSPADVYLIREALTSHGVSADVRWVDNGEAAVQVLDSLEAHPDREIPALVLLDLNLPRVNGLEVLQRLRAGSRCGGLPVLVLTSTDAP